MTNEQLVLRIRAGENTAANMLQLWQQNQGADQERSQEDIGIMQMKRISNRRGTSDCVRR